MNLKFKTLLKTKISTYFFAPRFSFSRFQFNLTAILFISVGLATGTYLAIAKIIIPSVFGTDYVANVLTFDSSTASSYTYNGSQITIDDSGAQAIASTNKFTNPNFDTNNNSWVPSLNGWVLVPGNSSIGTSDFSVMKYEAKCANNSNLEVGLTSPTDGMTVYRDDGVNNTSNNCTAANNRSVVSVASGYPIANINQVEAIARCSSISINGMAGHLINSNEWMTINRDAESQSGNWSLGSVGSGYFYTGHNDYSPGRALVASTIDTGNYRCAYTDNSTENPSTCPTYTASSNYYSAGNQVRTWTLSNGQVIWDMAGNLYEFNDTLSSSLTLGTWSTWNNLSSSIRDLYGPLNIPSDPGSMGKAIDNGHYTGGAFVRGGSCINTSYSGAYSLMLFSPTNDRGSEFGFRCVVSGSVSVGTSQTFDPNFGHSINGSNKVTTSSSDYIVSQSIDTSNSSNYNLSVYVYDDTVGNVGGTINNSIAQLEFDGNTIETGYTNSGSGWWKLSAIINGATGSKSFGVSIKSNKTVHLDDFNLLSTGGNFPIYNTSVYSNNQIIGLDSISVETVIPGSSSITYQVCINSTCSDLSSWKFWNGSSWETTTNITTDTNTIEQLSLNDSYALKNLSLTNKKFSIKAILNTNGNNIPSIQSISTNFNIDPNLPLSVISIKNLNGTDCFSDNCFTNKQDPAFNWTINEDNGSGLLGYCLYLGNDPFGDPTNTSGMFYPGSSPNGGYWMDGSPCYFILPASSSSFDISTGTYDWGGGATYYSYYDYPYGGYYNSYPPLGSGVWYFNVRPIFNDWTLGSLNSFGFHVDSTPPTNVAYISPAGGNFSNVADMSFSWPTSGDNSSSSDGSGSGVLGWQYQINSTSGVWQGSTTSPDLGINYIPVGKSIYTLTQARDGDKIVSGNNVIYFRTVDKTGNFSTDATIRTGNLSFGGAAPSFNQSDKVTINPAKSQSNSFALSWPQATAGDNRVVTHYYYMVNNPPPSTLATLQGNASTYIDNGNSTTVAAKNLPGVHKGTNTVYVVAIDDSSTPNYSPSNYTSGTFELDSTDPDPVNNLVASDSSIKSQSQWNVTLTWTAPTYQGAGNLVYHVWRSSDGISFTEAGTSTGLSFVDNVPSSKIYYYKVQTKDGAGAGDYSFTNAISVTPTGKWTSAPTLETQPTVTNITTKKATVTWSTNRSSDSKVAFGTTSGKYNDEEPSNSSQVSSHSINLTGLLPGTTYYYKTKWTDEDGNTGTSEEKSFTTAPAPVIKDVTVKNINLNSGLIQFTSTGASKVKVYYGNSTSFGGALEIPTSTNEATYTVNLIGLADGTKYYYKINAFDSENSEYEGTTLDFTTIPRPKITNVQLQEVAGTSQSTILVTWDTNTEISSIVTYYPEGQPDQSHDEVSVQLVKGEHKMILRGLTNQLRYTLFVKGRDRNGNEALSDTHRFTTASDTRPPQISSLSVEGQSVPQISGAAQEATAQLTVSWNTDEPATSQVEFSEGTGTDYSQKTQEDTKLTYNHLVIISNLTPSKVYHLKAVSRDKAFNAGKSIDTVTIAPKATDNALDLVVSNLSQVFGFLGGLGK